EKYHMNTKTIFVLTRKGQDEVAHKSSLLFGDMKRALSMIDGNASFGDLSKRAAPSLRSVLSELCQELMTSGFIEDKAKVGLGAKIKVPTSAGNTQNSPSELDFTTIMRAPSAQDLAAEAAKIQAAKEQADALGLKAQQDIAKQAADAKAQAENEQRIKQHELRSKAVAEAKLRDEQEAAKQAEQQAKALAEVARVKAEQAAKQQAEEVARAKQAADEAKLKAEQELAKVRQEAEAAKQKAEAEARARAEAEERAKAQAEAARVKAEQEAQQRLAEEARAKQAAEAQRLKLEQEAKQRAELAAREQQKLEELKRKAEQELQEAKRQAEAQRVQAEQEAMRLKQQAEAQAQAAKEAARLAQQQAETARLAAEQAAAQARAELAAVQRQAEQESQARLVAENARKEAELAVQQAREAAQLLSQQEQAALNEIATQQAAQVREEEETRAKQHALAAMSTQVRSTPFDTSSPAKAGVKLAAIDLASLTDKAAAQAQVQHAQQSVEQDKQAKLAAELNERKQQEQQLAEQQQAQQVEAEKLAAQQLAEAKQKDAAEAKKLADVQAKAWVAAEQKAVAAAQSHADVAATAASAERRTQPRAYETPRAKRKPLPWGGIAIALLLVMVAAAWLAPFAINSQTYVSKIEAQLSNKLQQPVHIGSLNARLLPTPRVTLNEVYIGEVKQIKAQKVVLSVGFASLFNEVKRIDNVELQDAELNVSGVLDAPSWLEKIAQDVHFPITRVVFERAKLNAPSVQFDDLAGELNFAPSGKFLNASVRANAGKYVLKVAAGADSKLDTELTVHSSALPLLPNWVFDDLTAKGELTRTGFVVNDLDGRIAGGVILGAAKLDWSSAWNMQGTLTAKTMTLVSFSKLLEGDMDGTARFKLQAASLDKLADSAQLEGNFTAKKGVLSGADIVETARLRSKENLPGGRTHFDEMSGALNYSNNVYHFKQLKIKSSVLNANGAADISNRQLTGRVGASLSIQENAGAVELQLSGNIDTPNLHAAR
ncbi:MAG: hypothetical protein ACXWTX_04890, partial [Gallionella sp.]